MGPVSIGEELNITNQATTAQTSTRLVTYSGVTYGCGGKYKERKGGAYLHSSKCESSLLEGIQKQFVSEKMAFARPGTSELVERMHEWLMDTFGMLKIVRELTCSRDILQFAVELVRQPLLTTSSIITISQIGRYPILRNAANITC
jgi:hypothetical protein